jgi:hypothetical protein
MPAHSRETIGEIAARPVAIRRARFLGIDLVMKIAGSAAESILRDRRTQRDRSAQGKTTHTDPQLLFWAIS